MVTATSSSPNHNAHENERRRKQTVERAKANHLSRQLQLRLQYARLKVDHGWEKQNLNEVENLYFHHSHQRGPKPYPSTSMVTTTRDSSTSYTTTTTSNLHLPKSSLSFKLGPSSLSRSHTSANLREEWPLPDSNALAGSSNSQSPHTTDDLVSPNQSATVPLIEPTQTKTLIEMEVDPTSKCSATPPTHPRHASSPLPVPSHTPYASDMVPYNTPGTIPRSDSVPQMAEYSTPLTATWNTAMTQPSPSSSPSNHYPNVPNRQPHAAPPQPRSNMSPNDNLYAYPGVSLTYDSFWSSHSTSTRPFRAPVSPASPMLLTGLNPRAGLTSMSDIVGPQSYQAGPGAAGGVQPKMTARATAGREG
ncbi:hypothetical protein H0H81_012722 [Sphagnurus paluster]|uniref:Uncharacterized protein n=1 Tax=Sphagnurus paluster TaxID=117069 RepID=A0A9P7KHY4_9AGAR|nr:hypothetical protein H0H81_012722 [Sphagnurus paluster]